MTTTISILTLFSAIFVLIFFYYRYYKMNGELLETQIIKHSPDGIVGINKEGKIVLVNPSAYKMFQYSPDELIGQSISKIIPIEFETSHTAHVANYFEAPKTRKLDSSLYEFYGLKKDGSKFPVLISLSYIKNNSKSIALSCIHDLSDFVNRLNTKDGAHTHSEIILKSIVSPMAKINSDGKIVWINKAWIEFGLKNGLIDSSKSGIGSNYFEVCMNAVSQGDLYAQEALDGIKSILNGHSNDFEMEYPCHAPNDFAWFLLRAIPESTSDKGDSINAVITHIEITTRKKFELQLEEQNRQLIKVNSELDSFIYSLSHDIRSPLTAISALSQFIANESKEKNSVTHAEMIFNRTVKLDRYLHNILDFIKNKNTGTKVNEVFFKDILEEIVDLNLHQQGSNDLKIEYLINQEQPFYTDKTRVTMICQNLLSNAIKFAGKGKANGLIEITLNCDDNLATLSIKDNGPGIAEENYDKIFDLFYRIQKDGSGSGMGLYLAKEMTTALQGTIEIISEIDKYTIFTITLPKLLKDDTE